MRATVILISRHTWSKLTWGGRRCPCCIIVPFLSGCLDTRDLLAFWFCLLVLRIFESPTSILLMIFSVVNSVSLRCKGRLWWWEQKCPGSHQTRVMAGNKREMAKQFSCSGQHRWFHSAVAMSNERPALFFQCQKWTSAAQIIVQFMQTLLELHYTHTFTFTEMTRWAVRIYYKKWNIVDGIRLSTADCSAGKGAWDDFKVPCAFNGVEDPILKYCLDTLMTFQDGKAMNKLCKNTKCHSEERVERHCLKDYSEVLRMIIVNTATEISKNSVGDSRE